MINAPEFSTITLHVDGYVATLTLNRPETMNRIGATMHDEIHQGLQLLAEMKDIRVAIIKSTGRCFSAGGDFDFITHLNANPDEGHLVVDEAISIINDLIKLPIPVIASVQGDAVGFGASLALGCDIIVANKGARFGDPHVLVGLVAGDGGCLFWPLSAGFARAKRYLLTGDLITAEKAYDFGLVTDLVESKEQLDDLTQELGNKIANMAPMAVQGTKKALSSFTQLRADEVVRIAAEYERDTMLSDDVIEAISAMKERRKPEFKGC